MATALTQALIYCRVSTDDQAQDGLSLDTQLDAARRYAAARPDWVIGSEYQDVMSGTRDDRPAYQQLLSEVRHLRKSGRPVAVVTAALDRFGRKLLERVRSREEFKQLGVTVHSVREGEVNDMMAGFLAVMAEEESKRIGQRVREVRKRLTAHGWLPFGKTAFGYGLRPATAEERKLGSPRSVLDVDPLRAPIAHEAFERVAGGEPVRNVARWLGSLSSDLREGRSFGLTTVRQMLRTRTYIGQDKDGKQGNWPALVDLETWERVQGRFAGHKKMPRQASNRYLLTGLLRCPDCGGRMTGERRSGGKPPRYSCNRFSNATCRYSANVAKIDAPVLAEVGALLDEVLADDPAIRAATERAWRALSEPTVSADVGTRRAHEQAAEKARERIRRLALLYADGEIDRAGYDLGRERATADLEAAERELEKIHPAAATPALPPLANVLRLAGGWRELLVQGSMQSKRDVLSMLVDHVTADRTGFGKFRPIITWTPMGAGLKHLAETAS